MELLHSLVKEQELYVADFQIHNQCNHFSIFKSTWATNVIGAGFIWMELRYPIPPKFVMNLK